MPEITKVDAYYVFRDNYIDIIFENVISPTWANHAKHNVDKEKSCRNATDALFDPFYKFTGSFETTKGCSVIVVIVFRKFHLCSRLLAIKIVLHPTNSLCHPLGHEVTVYTTNIKHGNEYNVSKVFQGRHYFSKDVYLSNLLLHLKFCLTIKVLSAVTAFPAASSLNLLINNHQLRVVFNKDSQGKEYRRVSPIRKLYRTIATAAYILLQNSTPFCTFIQPLFVPLLVPLFNPHRS